MKKKSEDKVSQYPNSIDTRVALLEQSISHINETLMDIKLELKEFRKEVKEDIKDLKKWSWTHFVFLFASIAALTAVVAHGFHWY